MSLFVSAAILVVLAYFALLCCLEVGWFVAERLPARISHHG